MGLDRACAPQPRLGLAIGGPFLGADDGVSDQLVLCSSEGGQLMQLIVAVGVVVGAQRRASVADLAGGWGEDVGRGAGHGRFLRIVGLLSRHRDGLADVEGAGGR